MLAVIHALGLVALCVGFMSAATAADRMSAEETVLSFNRAISAKDTDAMLSHLADGGAQFTLRSAHAGTEPESLTVDIVSHWRTIGPVVFASTSAYERKAKILESRVDDEIATVWAQMTVRTTPLGSDDSHERSFTEAYMLVSKPDGWKIAAIADNRAGTKLSGE